MALRRSLLMLLLGAWAVLGTGTASRAAGKDLAILVVGRASDKDMAARERALVSQLTRARSQDGWSHKTLPIYSYHFDKNVERAYCEERLKVAGGELIVVGVVELESGVPVRFLQRENGIKDVAAAAGAVMERADKELLARGAQPVKTAATPPPAKPADKPVATVPVTAPQKPAVIVPVAPPQRPADKPVTVTPPQKPADKPVATTTLPTTNNGTIVVGPPEGTPPTTSVDGERWSVQLGLFSSLDKARTLADQVRDAGNPVEIRKDMKDGAVIFRVLTGTFGTQADAYRRAKELKESGLQAFSVRVDSTLGTVVP